MTPEPPFPFIVGRGRSGTTLVRAMVDSSPEITIPEESHFIVRLGSRRERYDRPEGFGLERFLDHLLRHWAFRRWGLPEAEVRASLRASPPADFADAVRRVYELFARSKGKARYGDKTPRYVMDIPFLGELFPESRFIHLVRDGRNVALSNLDAGLGSRTVVGNAWWWKRYVERGRSDGRRLGPERYLELRYEDLVDDPERQMRRIARFIDVSFHPDMLRYFEHAEDWMNDPGDLRRHRSLFLPPTKGLRDWRREMSRDDVELFEAVAGEALVAFGYERACPTISRWARFGARRGVIGAQLERAQGRAQRARRRTRRLLASAGLLPSSPGSTNGNPRATRRSEPARRP